MLEHFFGSKTRLKLLQTFFRSPDKPFYVRELARLVGTQLNAVRREIANLESLGIIGHVPNDEVGDVETGSERSKYYRLLSSSILFPELKALLMKAQLVEEQHLIESIKTKAGNMRLFMLTGHFTSDREVGTDMLLVGDVKPSVVARLVKGYEAEIDQPIRYTLMTEKEFADRRQLGDKFLYSIFEAKHILLINDYNLS